MVDNDGKVVGIITDGDLRRKIDSKFLDKTAGEIMTLDPKVVSEDMFAQEATKIMNKYSITSLLVCKDKIPCGIIHIHDCLRAGLA